jgi:DNA-binding transcriptional LysR family regulator
MHQLPAWRGWSVSLGVRKGKKEISVGVTGPLIVDDLGLVLRAVLDGVGLAFVAETDVPDHLAEGTLLRVLQDWCQPYPEFLLYYPSRRQQTASLTALISVLRL